MEPGSGAGGAGEGEDVVLGQALGRGHGVDEGEGLLVEVASALGDQLLDRLDGLGAGAHRVLVGVDLHGIGRNPGPGREALGQGRLAEADEILTRLEGAPGRGRDSPA